MRHTRAVLEDLRALESMLEGDLLETGVCRFGAEQEVFLVDADMAPARAALRLLERLDHPSFTTELGLYNLEANLSPQPLSGKCFSDMARELDTLLARAREEAHAEGLELLLTGILPTLEESDLGLDAMTPIPRYQRLNDLMVQARGSDFQAFIRGLDQLEIACGTVMLEACNTSFQVHIQVSPHEFVEKYNRAQLITAPVLAAAVNSPLLFGHRLWHETRVALMQQSLDTRPTVPGRHARRRRVSFGERWVERSVLELYREDLARFRILVTLPDRESPVDVLARGGVPALDALALHNGTIYRWNRPCYGVTAGRPHMRIENRVLPSGPTVRDELANAAFFLGLMQGVHAELDDPASWLPFDSAEANFLAAARYGLDARFRWRGGRRIGADELIVELLPVARDGLERAGVDEADASDLLGIVEERVRSGRTGARWVLDGVEHASKPLSNATCRSIAARIAELQWSGPPAHEWPAYESTPCAADRESARTAGRIMSTDLVTVGPDDSAELAANVMDWRHIRHLPVEENGRLVGILSHRTLLRLLARSMTTNGEPMAVRDVMVTTLRSITPETPTLDVIRIMREERLGCLPVVRDGRLVGIVTERDVVNLSVRLLDHWLARPAEGSSAR